MSKPDLDIIRSPEAKAFLRSVTEGFYNRSYLGLWMYEVIGREWDEMAQWSADLKREIFVQTCTWSIAVWEWVYGFESGEGMTLEERRQRILNKIHGVRPINPEILRRGISAVSGADAGVTDFTAPYSFGVTLGITDRPVPMERVLQYIYENKPAHLAVSVETVFPEMESTLHVGGPAGNSTRFPIPREPDEYDFQNTLYAGGNVGAEVSVAVPTGVDAYDFHSELHAGGNLEVQAAFPVPEDTALPTATTILHTGGVCTIISNLSGGSD